MNNGPRDTYGLSDLIGSSDRRVGFEMFFEQALVMIDMSFELVLEPEADVPPFAMIAEGPDIYDVRWQDLGP